MAEKMGSLVEEIIKHRFANSKAPFIDLTPDTMSVREVSKALGNCVPTVLRYVHSGAFERVGVRVVRLGRAIRFVRSDVLALMQRQQH